MTSKTITVVGAGITGLWQALLLARAGHNVKLGEASTAPFTNSASILAGAMLAPFCESETAEPVVHELGVKALPIWLENFPQAVRKGSLVVANARDRSELMRFSRLTKGHTQVDAAGVAALEPSFSDRFASGLFFADEAHMAPETAMQGLLSAALDAGAEVEFGSLWDRDSAEVDADETALIIDCRGMAARDVLPSLRGVRGERIIVRSRDVQLSRPVRLLHPRHPLYIVPWLDNDAGIARDLHEHRYMIGSTLLESEDTSAMTVRSALEILGMAYALHPSFGEAEILDMAAGVRPAFPDNIPKIVVRGRHIMVNGMYRHGFLVAPVMAQMVADYLASGTVRDDVFVVE